MNISMCKSLAILSGVVCILAPAFPRQDRVICGTRREQWREELFLHRRSERARSLARKSTARAQVAAPASRDIGNLAVIGDGDGVVARRNDFNLVSKTIAFLPTGQGAYRFTVSENTYDVGAASGGNTLAGIQDDDFREVALPFRFPFFGSSYDRVFVNSDGNLTFGSGDNGSGDRSLGRLSAGPSRIAVLFRDLDPTHSSSGIHVLAEPQRAVFSWVAVPEYRDFGTGPLQTFQARLYPDGRIEFAYLDVNTTSAVVGIAPGNLAGTTSLVSFAGGSSGDYTSTVAEIFRDSLDLDVVRAAQKFYETHEDAYDYLVFFNTLAIPAGDSAVAYESTVRNNRSGYGDAPVDVGKEFGSPRRLQAVMNMGPLEQYPENPNGIVTARQASRDTPLTILAHEAGHLFLAFASVRDENDPEARPMLGYQNAHWAFTFNSDASLLEGNRIRDDGSNASLRFVTTGTVEAYSLLDQYLMGFRAPDDVLPTFLVTGTSQYFRIRPPQPGVSFNGDRRNVQVQEIVDAEGRRTPDWTVAQRHFRFAFVVITEGGADPDAAQVARIENYRTEFEKFYRRAASERAWADATLRRALRLSASPASGVLEGGTANATFTLAEPAWAAFNVVLRTQTGAATVPGTVSIAAGATSATFPIRGVRVGVEELSAEPSDGAYETAYARIQVANGSSGVRVLPASDAASNGPVSVRVTDINNLPYPSITVRAVAEGGTVTPSSAVTDENGMVSFQWSAGAGLRVTADGVSGGFTLGVSGNPVVAEGGVVNAASGSSLLAAGALATLYGSNLAGGATVSAALPWPDTLAAVRVNIAGRLAPLLYVSDGQINFLMPDLPEGFSDLAVTTPVGSSPPVRVRISGVAPGIFAAVKSGTAQSVAARGDFLEIYATGLGPVRSPDNGLKETVFKPEVRVGGTVAEVTYSGLTPGFLGLYQVNAQVPQSVAPGAQAVTISINDVRSNPAAVTIE